MNDAVMVLTFKSVERLLAEGGTSSWRLNRNEALKRQYAICTRNRFDDRCEGIEPHGSAFLIGRIKDVVPAPGRDGRWLILFSAFAHVDIEDVWLGDRNPVRYASLADLRIDPGSLNFQPMPEKVEKRLIDKGDGIRDVGHGLTIAEAKNGLAATFGVSPEAVEITIRG